MLEVLWLESWTEKEAHYAHRDVQRLRMMNYERLDQRKRNPLQRHSILVYASN